MVFFFSEGKFNLSGKKLHETRFCLIHECNLQRQKKRIIPLGTHKKRIGIGISGIYVKPSCDLIKLIYLKTQFYKLQISNCLIATKYMYIFVKRKKNELHFVRVHIISIFN